MIVEIYLGFFLVNISILAVSVHIKNNFKVKCQQI